MTGDCHNWRNAIVIVRRVCEQGKEGGRGLLCCACFVRSMQGRGVERKTNEIHTPASNLALVLQGDGMKARLL